MKLKSNGETNWKMKTKRNNLSSYDSNGPWLYFISSLFILFSFYDLDPKLANRFALNIQEKW